MGNKQHATCTYISNQSQQYINIHHQDIYIPPYNWPIKTYAKYEGIDQSMQNVNLT